MFRCKFQSGSLAKVDLNDGKAKKDRFFVPEITKYYAIGRLMFNCMKL